MNREQLEAYNIEEDTWQGCLAKAFKSSSELSQVLDNVAETSPELYKEFDARVTPYVVQLMDKQDPNCPIRIQYVPTDNELSPSPVGDDDSLSEDHDMIPGTSVVHRYPNRVLFLAHNICSSYCRYCTRKRLVSDKGNTISFKRIEASIEYIGMNKDVQDVLISGGDPLLLPDSMLEKILSGIRNVRPDLKILRIGSRVPAQLPTRITDNLVSILEKNELTLLNTHVNHPKEITPVFKKHIKKLLKAGIMVGNQSVLLKGVNDSVEVMRELCMELISCGVRPYYVYSCDPTKGNAAFTVNYDRMLAIYHGLRGHISGPAIPTFVIDGVGGTGKMPVIPEYVSKVDGKLIATNFEGISADHSYLLMAD